jgi:rare lipoprotein A
MRLLNENPRFRHAGAALGLGLAAAALRGCGMFGGHDAVLADALPAAQARTGPAADYPVVVGSPYEVDGTLYTPVDTLNYDEVGYAALDGAGGNTVSAAHHTLPLPSYVEVTSLTTGRTILVRVERRGPMTDNSLIALSPGAAAQLGASDKAPVRVRRVNPPEPERAALRLGGRASDRLETPETLLAVLRRKLPSEGSAPLAQAKPAPGELPVATAGAAAPVPAHPAAVAAARPAPVPSEAAPALPPLAPLAVASTPARQAPPTAAPVSAPPRVTAAVTPAPQPRPKPKANPPVTPNGAYVVQAGAFSTADRARKVANAVGGSVSRSGKLFRVRTGPFGSRTQAEASLAKVKAAGYSDARIFTNG